MAIFRKNQNKTRSTSVHTPNQSTIKVRASPTPQTESATSLDPSSRSLGLKKLFFVGLLPSLITGIVVTWFSYQLTGKIQLDLEARKSDIEARKAAANDQANALGEISAKIAEATQRAQQTAYDTQKELGFQSSKIEAARLSMQQISTKSTIENERRRADIEEKRQKIETIRLASEIVKAQNELIPILTIACQRTHLWIESITVSCKQINNGIYKVQTNFYAFELVSKDDDTLIPDGIKKLQGNRFNTMPAKVSASNEFLLELSDSAKAKVHANTSIKLKIMARATTDEKAVLNLKKLGGDIVDAQDLERLAEQGYTNTIDLN